MMNCSHFQELVSDYIEGELAPVARAECASHRLICRECRALYDEVKAMVRTLNGLGEEGLPPGEELTGRIMAATTAGEMLGCREFDQLLAGYFDGVIMAPTYHTFQYHFLSCEKCRRLMAGVEEAISLCHEIRETEIEMPENLPERIVAATAGVGASAVKRGSGGQRWWARGRELVQTIDRGRVAAAILIIAASGLLIVSRYGSVSGMATHATMQADLIVLDGQERLSRTSIEARGRLERLSRGVNTLLGPEERPAAPARRRVSPPPAIDEGQAE